MAKYVFTFHTIEKDNQIGTTAIYKTKDLTEESARRLLIEELAKMGKKGFCYKVETNGRWINLLKETK